jgi:hypothetical protein
MDRATEERWSTALEKRGLAVVRQELDLRPGKPGDVIYNVVDDPPYPTRAFCEAWCRGTPQETIALPTAGMMMAGASALIVVCIIKAITSWSPADANWLSDKAGQFHSSSSSSGLSGMGPGGGSGGGTGGSSDNSIQNTAAVNAATKNNSLISTQAQSSLLPSCTTVANAGNLATVTSVPACSKVGQPLTKPGGSSSGGSVTAR